MPDQVLPSYIRHVASTHRDFIVNPEREEIVKKDATKSLAVESIFNAMLLAATMGFIFFLFSTEPFGITENFRHTLIACFAIIAVLAFAIGMLMSNATTKRFANSQDIVYIDTLTKLAPIDWNNLTHQQAWEACQLSERLHQAQKLYRLERSYDQELLTAEQRAHVATLDGDVQKLRTELSDILVPS